MRPIQNTQLIIDEPPVSGLKSEPVADPDQSLQPIHSDDSAFSPNGRAIG